MRVVVHATPDESGQAAAMHGAEMLRAALAQRGSASIIVATGASQFAMLEALVAAPDIDWSRVTGFHLDEYIGLAPSHPASFRKYLRERFVERVPIGEFHYIRAEDGAAGECERLGKLISTHTIAVAFVGIGENGHLAFNDPPADFTTTAPYLVVELDEACRRQQHGEGWFPTLNDVPRQAISMSVQQILKSQAIVCTVPDLRKAEAVRDSVSGPVTPDVPASVLQSHGNTSLFLDQAAASLLASK